MGCQALGGSLEQPPKALRLFMYFEKNEDQTSQSDGFSFHSLGTHILLDSGLALSLVATNLMTRLSK